MATTEGFVWSCVAQKRKLKIYEIQLGISEFHSQLEIFRAFFLFLVRKSSQNCYCCLKAESNFSLFFSGLSEPLLGLKLIIIVKSLISCFLTTPFITRVDFYAGFSLICYAIEVRGLTLSHMPKNISLTELPNNLNRFCVFQPN